MKKSAQGNCSAEALHMCKNLGSFPGAAKEKISMPKEKLPTDKNQTGSMVSNWLISLIIIMTEQHRPGL